MRKEKSSYGGAALEYIIVSAFAGSLSLIAIGFVTKLTKEKISQMSEALGSDAEVDLSPLEALGL